MLGFLKRLRHPQAPALYQYHPGPVLSPGASDMVLAVNTALPLHLATGTGIRIHQRRITNVRPLWPVQNLIPRGTNIVQQNGTVRLETGYRSQKEAIVND